MNTLDKQYQSLLKDILDNGISKQTRNGETISVFGRQIRYKFKDGKFPLLTTKKMAWKTMVTELLWFLRGHTNIRYLVDNNCHIWDGDAYKAFLQNHPPHDHLETKEEFINKIKTDDEFAREWGYLGPIYGAQWRKWDGIDQITNLINDLKTNPDSRRLMVNAWNVGELGQCVLPPCHYGFQVYTRELTLKERLNLFDEFFDITNDSENMNESEIHESLSESNIPTRAISLMFNMRSNDVPLGLPFNIASYGLLLEIIGNMVNMIPDELIANLGDAHIYKNQIDGVKEQLTREPYPLPKLVISDDINFNGTIDDFLNSCSISDLKIEGYQSHPPIKIPLSN